MKNKTYKSAMTRHINYPGFCKTDYGLAVMALAYALPPALQAGINIMAERPAFDETAMPIAMMLGMWGFAAGAAAHIPANSYASKRGYGLTRGAALVRKAQAAGYAVTVAAGMAFANAAGPGGEKPDSVAPVPQDTAPAARTARDSYDLRP